MRGGSVPARNSRDRTAYKKERRREEETYGTEIKKLQDREAGRETAIRTS